MSTVDEIKEKLLKGLGSAVNLQIVTYVGEVKPVITSDDGSIIGAKWDNIASAPTDFAIATQINLAEGDIITITPAQVNEPDKQWIKDYHLEQVKAGKDIVASNLRMIAEMAEKILKLAE
ncbi:MAG: hypothetical protein ACXWUC_06625 [Methylosarcina sp.]